MVNSDKQDMMMPPEMKFGIFRWVRKNLFSNLFDTIVTISVVLFLLWIVPAVISWMFIDAVGFGGDEALCRSAKGACWPFMREKARLILFGTYPYDQQWRAALASLIVISSTDGSVERTSGFPAARCIQSCSCVPSWNYSGSCPVSEPTPSYPEFGNRLY